MKNRFLWVGVGISLALHITLLVLAGRVDLDSLDVVRKVKLRMVEEAAQRKKEKAEPKIEADEKEEQERKAKAAAEAERLKALQKKVPPRIEPPKVEPPKVEPPKVDPPKVDPRKEEPPKKEEKPEVKPPDKKLEESQKKETDKPKVKKIRKQKTDKPVDPKKAEEPKTTDPQKEGPPPDGRKHGVPLDLDYAMDGTSKGAGGSAGGSGIPVVAGDGLDVPEDEGDGGGDEEEGAADDEEFVDQDELYDEEDGLQPEDEGGPGTGNPADRLGKGVGGADVKKNEKKARVKTVAAHKVSRTASVSKGVDVPYPEEVKGLEIQGRVHLELTVDRNGKVADVKLKRGLHPVLDRVSMEAAWKLEFSPALKEGEPVAVKIPYTFTFVLE